MSTRNRWSDQERPEGYGEEYAARFAALAASGQDMHGEASFCAALVPPGSKVLDAGCGTGRVAIRLAELGYSCVGVDADEAMLDIARRTSTQVEWHLLDLVDIGSLDGSFGLVVAAGNVMPLLADGTEAVVISGLAEKLAAGGLLVAGFGLDVAHLPLDEVPFGLDQYDRWCAAADLEFVDRFATWSADPYLGESGGYAVSVHCRRK